MKIQKISIAVLLTFCLASGCSENNERLATASLTAPLFRECIETIEDYEVYINRIFEGSSHRVEFEVKYFDRGSYALPSIVGYFTLSIYWSGKTAGGDTPFESLEIKMNSVMAECYPENIIRFNIENTSMVQLDNVITSNINKGIKENYLLLDGSELKLYFNDQRYKLPD